MKESEKFECMELGWVEVRWRDCIPVVPFAVSVQIQKKQLFEICDEPVYHHLETFWKRSRLVELTIWKSSGDVPESFQIARAPISSNYRFHWRSVPAGVFD
jgi:hypothetical protein